MFIGNCMCASGTWLSVPKRGAPTWCVCSVCVCQLGHMKVETSQTGCQQTSEVQANMSHLYLTGSKAFLPSCPTFHILKALKAFYTSVYAFRFPHISLTCKYSLYSNYRSLWGRKNKGQHMKWHLDVQMTRLTEACLDRSHIWATAADISGQSSDASCMRGFMKAVCKSSAEVGISHTT